MVKKATWEEWEGESRIVSHEFWVLAHLETLKEKRRNYKTNLPLVVSHSIVKNVGSFCVFFFNTGSEQVYLVVLKNMIKKKKAKQL